MRRTKNVSICLEPEDHERIKQYAKQNYMSVSQVITKLIRNSLKPDPLEVKHGSETTEPKQSE